MISRRCSRRFQFVIVRFVIVCSNLDFVDPKAFSEFFFGLFRPNFIYFILFICSLKSKKQNYAIPEFIKCAHSTGPRRS